MEGVDLQFPFSFYGYENHRKIWINPNGFVSTNSSTCKYFCNWPTLTGVTTDFYYRFIAGYLTDLNPSQSTDAEIHWWQGVVHPPGILGLIVQFTDIPLYRRAEDEAPTDPLYTFQIHIYSDHTIRLLYYNMPRDATTFALDKQSGYPVRIGLEDAEIWEDGHGNQQLVRYRPLEVSFAQITEFLDYPRKQSLIIFTPKRACVDQSSCTSCVDFLKSQYDQPTRLNCGWCASMGLCTDLLDRNTHATLPTCPNYYYLKQTFEACQPTTSPPTASAPTTPLDPAHSTPPPSFCSSSHRSTGCSNCLEPGAEECSWCQAGPQDSSCRIYNRSTVLQCVNISGWPVLR
eukprot:gb/GEZN01004952.1/.p1 GENE.gb/GEZN01004952.1/~~gb/GEZN01004952.1/.p1  ORF type:complete len:345 (-),score=23.30 gb/GEZN01004952.1/:173-1207(-)